MRVSIKVTADLADALSGRAPKSERASRLQELVADAGATLQPMHPDVDDDELRTYYSAEVDDERCGQLLDQLRGSADVEGAYVKPPDALP